MLPRKMRLPHVLFKGVLKTGGFFRGRFFTLRFREFPNQLRFNVVVSKKVIAGAAGRNLLRRRVYSVFRELAPRLSKTGFFVFFCLPAAKTLQFKGIRDDILSILKLSGALK